MLKDATYETSIQAHKQMILEHDRQHQQKEAKAVSKLRDRLEKNKVRVFKKLGRMGVKLPECEEEFMQEDLVNMNNNNAGSAL